LHNFFTRTILSNDIGARFISSIFKTRSVILLKKTMKINIDIFPLKIKLKSKMRHAGATRNKGQSIWIKAERNGIKGFGEGCPRPYVTGENIDSCLNWVKNHFQQGNLPFKTFEDVKEWVETNSDIIDSNPSAWCAIELALLDLFSREKEISVEKLLGLDDEGRHGKYTAVLVDNQEPQFSHLANQYLLHGFSDFKIKLNGDFKKDKQKIDILEKLYLEYDSFKKPLSVRLDANNLWRNRHEEAISFLNELNRPDYPIEEPFEARDAKGISKLINAVKTPIILDESLCKYDDLLLYKKFPGPFIANIKVSKVGGLIRALHLIGAVKKLGWKIIIGCHVGETSLLTRAALIPAYAAGNHLIGREGAFGDHLLTYDPVEPMLKFGRHGALDLRASYHFKSTQGIDQSVPKEHWKIGFGMTVKSPNPFGVQCENTKKNANNL